jgi:hypothetical protein
MNLGYLEGHPRKRTISGTKQWFKNKIKIVIIKFA